MMEAYVKDLVATYGDYPALQKLYTVSLWLYGVSFFLTIIRGVIIHPKSARGDDTIFRVFAVCMLISCGAASAVLGYFLVLDSIAPSAKFFMNPRMGFILIPIGITFFYLKRNFTLIYGSIEILAALGVIAIVSLSSQDLKSRAVAALGAVYFLVRGLDNITKADPVKSWAKSAGIKD